MAQELFSLYCFCFFPSYCLFVFFFFFFYLSFAHWYLSAFALAYISYRLFFTQTTISSLNFSFSFLSFPFNKRMSLILAFARFADLRISQGWRNGSQFPRNLQPMDRELFTDVPNFPEKSKKRERERKESFLIFFHLFFSLVWLFLRHRNLLLACLSSPFSSNSPSFALVASQSGKARKEVRTRHPRFGRLLPALSMSSCFGFIVLFSLECYEWIDWFTMLFYHNHGISHARGKEVS